ncbi:hypothetical protein RYX36_012968, partial [Vicia faba]
MQGQEIKDLIINSIKIGYRHFDCAADYKNETEVGEAFKEAFDTGLVKREDLFITTQLWNSLIMNMLLRLSDYLDFYLVHFPVATRHTGDGTTDSALGEDGVLDIDRTISLETTWHVMEGLVSSGLVRSIGIINYDIFLNRDCLAYSKIKPVKNRQETFSSALIFIILHIIFMHSTFTIITSSSHRSGQKTSLQLPKQNKKLIFRRKLLTHPP